MPEQPDAAAYAKGVEPSSCYVCASASRPLVPYRSARGDVRYACGDEHACAEDFARKPSLKQLRDRAAKAATHACPTCGGSGRVPDA